MFVGRAAELHALQQTVLLSRQSVFLTGHAGAGKTTLVRTFTASASARRLGSTTVAGLPGTAFPLAPFAHLLGDDAVPSQSPIELLVRLRGELARRAANEASILVVDDAHWLDEGSTSLIRQLVHDGVMPVVLVARTGEPLPDGLRWVESDGEIAHLELGPLERDECDRMVVELLAAPAAADLLDAIWGLSAGVPLFVAEAVRTARRSGAIGPRRSGSWQLIAPIELPAGIVRVIGAHVDHLGTDERRLLTSLAVGGALPIEIVERMETAAQLGSLVDEGLARVTRVDHREIVDLNHDLQRQAIIAGSDSLARRVSSRDLIEAIEAATAEPAQVVLAARLRWEIGQPDPTAFEMGASISFNRFDFEWALRLADAAISSGAGFRAHLARAAALGALGRRVEADGAFEAALAVAVGEAEVVEAGICVGR